MNPNQELKTHLMSALAELEQVSKQIQEVKDYSENAELLILLKELVLEQVGAGSDENSSAATHTTR